MTEVVLSSRTAVRAPTVEGVRVLPGNPLRSDGSGVVTVLVPSHGLVAGDAFVLSHVEKAWLSGKFEVSPLSPETVLVKCGDLIEAAVPQCFTVVECEGPLLLQGSGVSQHAGGLEVPCADALVGPCSLSLKISLDHLGGIPLGELNGHHEASAAPDEDHLQFTVSTTGNPPFSEKGGARVLFGRVAGGTPHRYTDRYSVVPLNPYRGLSQVRMVGAYVPGECDCRVVITLPNDGGRGREFSTKQRDHHPLVHQRQAGSGGAVVLTCREPPCRIVVDKEGLCSASRPLPHVVVGDPVSTSSGKQARVSEVLGPSSFRLAEEGAEAGVWTQAVFHLRFRVDRSPFAHQHTVPCCAETALEVFLSLNDDKATRRLVGVCFPGEDPFNRFLPVPQAYVPPVPRVDRFTVELLRVDGCSPHLTAHNWLSFALGEPPTRD